jgi:hypothetical protein
MQVRHPLLLTSDSSGSVPTSSVSSLGSLRQPGSVSPIWRFSSLIKSQRGSSNLPRSSVSSCPRSRPPHAVTHPPSTPHTSLTVRRGCPERQRDQDQRRRGVRREASLGAPRDSSAAHWRLASKGRSGQACTQSCLGRTYSGGLHDGMAYSRVYEGRRIVMTTLGGRKRIGYLYTEKYGCLLKK